MGSGRKEVILLMQTRPPYFGEANPTTLPSVAVQGSGCRASEACCKKGLGFRVGMGPSSSRSKAVQCIQPRVYFCRQLKRLGYEGKARCSGTPVFVADCRDGAASMVPCSTPGHPINTLKAFTHNSQKAP